MQEYIQPVIDLVTSTRSYIVNLLSQKRWLDVWVIQYIIIFWILYFISIYILHKIYRFFVSSTLKQKEDYFLSCDTILYEIQLENIWNPQNLEWIKDFLEKASYEESYKIFLEKASMIESNDFEKLIKKYHQSYNNARRRKMLCWVFLSIITLWVYRLFLEN